MGRNSIQPDDGNQPEVSRKDQDTFVKEESVNEKSPIVRIDGKKIEPASSAKTSRVVDIDTILAQIGEYSRYQILLTFLLSVFMIGTVPHNLSVVFYTLEPGWKCTTAGFQNGECRMNGSFQDGDDFFKERCHMNRSSWTFNTKKEFSIITEFELICNRSWMVVLLNGVGFLGGVFGALVTGIISDKFGRTKILLVSYLAMETIIFILSFSPNYEFLLVCMLVSGFFIPGIISEIFVILVEMVGPKRRAFASTLIWIPFALGFVLLSLQAYLVKDWRILARIISAPYLLTLLAWRIIPESLKWLQSQQKTEQAENILRKIARVNKKIYPDLKLEELPESDRENAKLRDLFLQRRWVLVLLLHGFIWCVYSIIYYGVSLSAAHLSGNIYINFAVLSAVEAPSVFCIIYLSDRFGRKKAVLFGNFLTVMTLAVVSAIPEDASSSSASGITRVTFGILSKFFVSIAFNAVYLLSTETFPTVLRSRGVHVLVIILQMGAFLAPWFTLGIRLLHRKLPYPILTVLCALAGLLSLKLEETKHQTPHIEREGKPANHVAS